MNRREALKGLGLSVGYAVAAPSMLSLLNSCKTNPELWQPLFLSPTEGEVLRNLVDLILPKTANSPGSSELNIAEFIDLLVFKTYTTEKQQKFQLELNAVINELGIHEEKDIFAISTEDYDAILAKYLRADERTLIAFESDKQASKVLDALKGIRAISRWSYRNTEEVGEKVLDYNPIPGKLYGCETYDEVYKERGKS